MRIPKLPPTLDKALSLASLPGPELFSQLCNPTVRQSVDQANLECWNWEDCNYRAHLCGLKPNDFWTLVKLARRSERQTLPCTDVGGRPFSYRIGSAFTRPLHFTDFFLAGRLMALAPGLIDGVEQSRFLHRSLREESIESALFEGANTTRDAAREMIRTGRTPRSVGERMVANNYATIRYLNEKRDTPLTPRLLQEVQRMITEGTFERADAAGRFRQPDEDITVFDEEDQQILHRPPPADELPERVQRMCDFANALNTPDEFIHPVIRAIVLHFWLAYDHPFVDGNGRTARALFYWSMLRQGYWLVEYLTISSVIAGHPRQYSRAYLNSEHDELDLTYFLHYHLEVIERSIRSFQDYVVRKQAENNSLSVSLNIPLNYRQRDVLAQCRKNPLSSFTYEGVANMFGVVLATAREDLLELEKLKLLKGNRKGRRFEFVPAPDIHARLKKLAGE